MVYVISQRPQVCGLTFAINVSIQTCRFVSCRPTPDSVKECNWFYCFPFQPCMVWLPGFLSDSHKVQAISQRNSQTPLSQSRDIVPHPPCEDGASLNSWGYLTIYLICYYKGSYNLSYTQVFQGKSLSNMQLFF